MERVGEFNIREWDGTVSRVTVVRVWNPESLTYDFRILYPDGVCHQIPAEHWEALKPREILCH